jgi:hypothetical protein
MVNRRRFLYDRAMTIAVGSLIAVPLPNGAFGVIWIIDDEMATLTFLVLDGFWPAVPERVKLRFMPRPFGEPADLCENVYKGWFRHKVPKDFVAIGARKLTPQARAHADKPQGTMVFQNAEHFRAHLHKQWRWLNDRERLKAEWTQAQTEYQAREAKRREQQTLPRMLRERPFSNWPSRKLVREARRIFKEATRELIRLQERGARRERVAVLKRIVTDLNTFDDKAGLIESVERDETVARVEELAALVGLSNDDEKLTGHRDW